MMTLQQDAEAALMTSTEPWECNFPALKPLSVLISFHGELPPNLRNETIPIKLTVSLPPEYAAYATLVLRKTPTAYLEWASGGHSSMLDETDGIMSDDCNSSALLVELQDVPIPFLPLEKSFNHWDVRSWSRLVTVISSWLVNDVKSLKRQEWTWGTNLFWMAFVTAYPCFPGGNWPQAVWDCRISLDGTFMQEWLDCGGLKGWCHQYNIPFDDSPEGLVRFHNQIWVQFKSYVSSFYISSVVA